MKRPTNPKNIIHDSLEEGASPQSGGAGKKQTRKSYKIDLLNSGAASQGDEVSSGSRRDFLKSTSGLTLASAFGLGLVASKQQALAQSSGGTKKYDEYIHITPSQNVTALTNPPANGSVAAITAWVKGYDAGATVTVTKGTYDPATQKVVPETSPTVTPAPGGLLGNKFNAGTKYTAKINKAVPK